MDKFDPDSAPYLKSSGFDPDSAPYLKSSSSEPLKGSGYPDWLRKSDDFVNKYAGLVNDVGKGTDASIINAISTLTGGLSPRYDPQGNQTAIGTGKLIGALASGAGAESIGASALDGAGSLPYIGNAIGKLPGIAKAVLTGGAGGAASSLGLDQSPTEGAAIGAALPPVLSGISNAYPLAKRGLTKLLVGGSKNVTPEEFEAATATIPEGVKAPIGEAANSPKAKNLYDFARSITGSFADKPYKQIFDHLNKGANELTSGAVKTDSPNQFIYDDLVKKYEGLKGNTKDAYLDLANYSDKRIPFNRGSYDSYLDSTLENIKNEMQRGPTAVDENKENLKQLQNLKEDKIENFSDAQKQKASINKLINDLGQNDKIRFNKSLLQGAKDSLEKSIEESSMNDPVAFEKYQKANNARIEQGNMERLNLRDKTPFFKEYDKKETSPSNIIGSYFKTGKYQDSSKLLSNLTDNLSPDSKKVLANHLVSPSGDESVAKKLNAINKLTTGQRNLIFGENSKKAEDLGRLAKIYSKSPSADFTPGTGWTGSKATQAVSELMAALTAIGLHHPAGALIATTPSLASNALQRTLRSNALKNDYLNYLRGVSAAPNRVSPLINNAARTALTAPGGNNGS